MLYNQSGIFYVTKDGCSKCNRYIFFMGGGVPNRELDNVGGVKWNLYHVGVVALF